MKVKSVLFMIPIFTALVLSACSTQQNTPAAAVDAVEEKQPVQAFGVVKARIVQDISVGFPVKISRILVQEGQAVADGATLAEVGTDEADAAVCELEGQVAALQLETSSKKEILARKKESVIKNSDPDVLKLENAFKKAQEEYDDLLSENAGKLSLAEAGALSGQEYLDCLQRADDAEFTCVNAELALKSLRQSRQEEIFLTESGINENLFKISELEKKVQKAKERMSSEYLRGNRIVSLIRKGIISNVNCKPGESLPAGGRLFSIMDASSLVIEANVDEQFIKDVKLGARAYIVPESDTDQEFKGKVTAVSEFALQQNSETVIPVQISLDVPYEGICPGYNMEVEIETQ